MSPTAISGSAPAIDVERRIVLQQRVETMEMVTGIEQPNRYDLHTLAGAIVGRADEIPDGAGSFLARWKPLTAAARGAPGRLQVGSPPSSLSVPRHRGSG